MAVKAVSVSQLNRYIGRVLSTDPILSDLCIKGEISGLKKHTSGHWYFDLKDSASKIRCFLHAARVPRLRYDLDSGLEVIVFGTLSVYEPGGYYSVNVTDIQLEGEGALAAAFERLKNKLGAEGLFDPARKRPLPAFPKRIGVVTSPTGAAVRDIITTIKRRYPLCDVLLYPANVQGEGSAQTVCDGIRVLNEKFPGLDLLIVGRGGGSAEDLWTFNEESVARAVFASRIPVISAVGHEVDTVITDLVADVRAATPTAAAELAVPHIESLKDRLRICSPENSFWLLSAMIERCESRLRLAKLDIEHLDPLGILSKGYAVVKDNEGNWLTSSEGLEEGKDVCIIFRDGSVSARVTKGRDTNA